MRCPACDAPNPRDAVRCEECGERLPRRSRRPDPDDEEDYEGSAEEAVATIIPYRNVPALIAYYLGIFGLIPGVGLALGPAALILGIIGLRKARAQSKAHGTGHAIAGIVLGVIDLYNWAFAIMALVGLLSEMRRH
jgi:membrane-bound ClpP family serine protease